MKNEWIKTAGVFLKLGPIMQGSDSLLAVLSQREAALFANRTLERQKGSRRTRQASKTWTDGLPLIREFLAQWFHVLFASLVPLSNTWLLILRSQFDHVHAFINVWTLNYASDFIQTNENTNMLKADQINTI